MSATVSSSPDRPQQEQSGRQQPQRDEQQLAHAIGGRDELLLLIFGALPREERCITVGCLSRRWRGWAAPARAAAQRQRGYTQEWGQRPRAPNPFTHRPHPRTRPPPL